MLVNESEEELDPNASNSESDILNDSQPSDLNAHLRLNMCGRNFNMTKPQFRTILLLSTYYIISSSYYSLLGIHFNFSFIIVSKIFLGKCKNKTFLENFAMHS